MLRNLFCTSAALVLFAGPAMALPPMPPSQVVAGVNYSTNLPMALKTDSSGNLYIVGTGVSGPVNGPNANGTAPSQPPVLTAGWDGTLLHTLKTDTNGDLLTTGIETAGSALTGLGFRVMGSDGTNARDIKTDTSGDVTVVGVYTGGNTAGATAPGVNLIGGTDGTNARIVLTDTSGRIILGSGTNTIGAVAGTETNGSPVTGNGFRMMGSDGSNAHDVRMDGTGDVLVAGLTANGSPTATNPILMAGSDGTNVRTILTDAAGHPNVVIANQPVIAAGSAIIGKVGIDQTTPGLSGTNAVASIAKTVTTAAQIQNTADTTGAQYVNTTGQLSTYTTTLATVPTASGVLLQLQGSSTKLVKILKVTIYAANASPANNIFQLATTSAAATGGTTTSVVTGSQDTSNSAATAAVLGYSAGATLGSVRANVDQGLYNSGGSNPIIWTPAPGSQPPTLRGTSQWFSVSAVASATTSFYTTITWTEE